MNVKVTVCRDNGANYVPQRVSRTMTLTQAEDAVTLMIVASFGYVNDATLTAASMYSAMKEKHCTAWGWSDNLRRVTIRVEKIA